MATAKPSFAQVVLTPPDLPPDRGRTSDSIQQSNESRTELIRRRFEALRRRSTTRNPICFKCGARGHISVRCRNARLCLVCNKHGHHSSRCAEGRDVLSSSKPTRGSDDSSHSIPPPSPHISVAMAGLRNPILLFNPTPESEQMLQNFQKSFILSDIADWGVDRVESKLMSVFSNLSWRVTIFDEKKYLVQAPTLEWQQSMTRRGVLRLDGVKFPVVSWEPRFSEGTKLTSLWVKIHGYPHLLWQWQEIDRMLNPLGAILLDMDPGAGKKCNWKFVRVRIGICDRELLPKHHWMMTRDATGYVSGSLLNFEIETELLVPGPSRKAGGRVKEPKGGAKSAPPPPPPPPPPSAMQADKPDNMETVPDTKGKKVAPKSDCKSGTDGFFDTDTSDEDEGLRAHLKKYYGGIQYTRAAHQTGTNTKSPPPSTQHGAQPNDSVEEPMATKATRLNWGNPNPNNNPKTPGVRYKRSKVIARKTTDVLPRSKSVGHSPLRGRSLLRSLSPRQLGQTTRGRGTRSLSAQQGQGIGAARYRSRASDSEEEVTPARRHFGPTGSRRGLRSTKPVWPTPSHPPSPTGATPDKPILLSDSSTAMPPDSHTPAISQETHGRRRFPIPRQSLRIQAKGDPTSVLTKAKKRAQEKGEGSSSGNSHTLLKSFLFRRLTISQVVDLFKVYQIQLGINEIDRIQMISAIQIMDRSKFELVIQDILTKTKSLPQDQLLLVDNINSMPVGVATSDTSVSHES